MAKRRRAKRKLNDKQALTIVISVACAIALLIGALVVIGIINKDAVNDPHAGHNHAAGEEHYEGDGHDHSSDTAKVKYQVYQEQGGTYRLVFRDAAGKSVAEFKDLTKQPIKAEIDKTRGIYELGWATGDGPNDFVCVYYNELTGKVSELFTAPRGTDGNRIAYGSADQKSVIVADLFDSKGYHKEYALENAIPNKSGDIILSGSLSSDKKSVKVSYHANGDDKTESKYATINLYA